MAFSRVKNNFIQTCSKLPKNQSGHDGLKYFCIQCDYKVADKRQLHRHKVAVHRGLKFSFNQCDLNFAQTTQLKRTDSQCMRVLGMNAINMIQNLLDS